MKWQKIASFILVSTLLLSARFSLAQKVDVNGDQTSSTADQTQTNDNSGKDNPSGNNGKSSSGNTGNNQVVSPDAIGLRIVPNPNHLSPLNWYYQNIKVKGSPQSIMVDGYEAIRDGRTVYVSAAKILSVNRCDGDPSRVCTSSSQCGVISGNESSLPSKFMNIAWAGSCIPSNIPELYTNIYIISYNQNPDADTTDIFGQLLQYWKFNIDINNCSKTVTQTCSADNNTPGGSSACPNGETCGPTGWCNQTNSQSCIIDADCPTGEYCNSKKATIIRDTKRLATLGEVKNKLEYYNSIVKSYPKLETGTYLTNRTISTWPSWSATFSSTIGSAMPVDPVNKLGVCKIDPDENSRFEASTCWDEKAKEFSGTADPLTPPSGSLVYYYQYKSVDNSFKFCTVSESGYVQAKNPMTELCTTGRSCMINCTNKQCGSNGCGGVCGTCSTGQICQSGRCRTATPVGND